MTGEDRHPVRAAVLRALGERPGARLSLQQIGSATGEPLSQVSYHLNVLGRVEVVGEPPTGDDAARLYRATNEPVSR